MPTTRTKPRIIPVLDVMNGQVVRAVGGRLRRISPYCESANGFV